MIIDSFEKGPSIVNLVDFYGPKKHLVNKCLVILSKKLFDHMISNFAVEKIGCIGACCGDTFIYSFDYEGEKIAFYLSLIGASLAGSFVSEASWQTGAEKFLMFGSCGSLDSSITNGKYIIPTKAYRDEGMSYHFVSPADYIEIKNNDELASVFAKLNIPFVRGATWTTDAMLRETKAQMLKRKSEGCIVVEMEIAGVEAVCQFYGLKLYTFLQAGDVLTPDTYDASGLGNANHDLDKLLIAIKALRML